MAKRVMVFGVFDRLHPGHHHFLKTASGFGDELIVVVARDISVSALKNKNPVEPQDIRLLKVGELEYVTQSVLGDEMLGVYEVIKIHQPDQICLGYDQESLEQDLKEKMAGGSIPELEILRVEAYRPEEFHSSLR